MELTEEEVQAAMEQEEAVALATATTTTDIKNLHSKKATVPKSFSALVSTFKQFANLLFALFGPLCPLATKMCKLIRAMTDMPTNARALDSCTIVAAMWVVVHKETRRFTSGQIQSELDVSVHWVHLQTSIMTAQSVHCNDVPKGIGGIPTPSPTTKPEKRKTTGGIETSTPTQDKPPAKVNKTCTDKESYPVHPRIAAEIVPRLPPGFRLRQALEKCKVDKNIFGNPNVCWHTALRGKCIYRGCTKDHDTVKDIDDAAVDSAIAKLAPVFKLLETKGKKL